tara:strand:- start:283 stop:384 length:102 start_codon:yes stop_codon:yes gene_type:complete
MIDGSADLSTKASSWMNKKKLYIKKYEKIRVLK